MIRLPAILAEIAEIAGLEAALAIADRRGGARVLIPRHAPDDHWLVEAVGREAADAICHHFAVDGADGKPLGTYEVYLPLGPHGALKRARRRLVSELENGASVRQAARKAGLTERTGWRIKRRLQSKSDQGELF